MFSFHSSHSHLPSLSLPLSEDPERNAQLFIFRKESPAVVGATASPQRQARLLGIHYPPAACAFWHVERRTGVIGGDQSGLCAKDQRIDSAVEVEIEEEPKDYNEMTRSDDQNIDAEQKEFHG